ncbi:MAG TPA: TetR/AcrR family transcriptional regulator [Polyangiaceae bacterium]
MSKGELTRARILDQALVLASRLGLDGLTLGVLADSLELSKSGLYAHFRSKEALILAVLEHTKARHLEHAAPYLEGKAKGLEELRAYLSSWLDWIALPTLPAGCPILGASFELEDLDGPARDYVVGLAIASRARLGSMLRSAIAKGELSTDTPIEQVLFELRGVSLSFHFEYRLLRETSARERAENAFSHVLARYTTVS